MNNFAIQYNDQTSKEAMAICTTATLNKDHFKIFKSNQHIPNEYTPVGSVEWVLKILNKPIKPDYYPEFLKDYLYRKVWKAESWPIGKEVFIKPADTYKRFTGFVTNRGWKGKKRGPYWCSEVIQFNNEWRYYVANGKVLTGEWYAGDEVLEPIAPELDIDIPKDYCGALDFGLTSCGKFALIEAQHPFSCGWYGKDHKLYYEWLIEGWKYMRKL